MRTVLLTTLMLTLAGFAPAWVSASPIADEANSSDQASDQAVSKAAADASEKSPMLTLPPGFKAKKRGDLTLYCIKGKATGTRFATESCYDEAGLHDYILKREQSNREFDQNRAICSNPAICAPQ